MAYILLNRPLWLRLLLAGSGATVWTILFFAAAFGLLRFGGFGVIGNIVAAILLAALSVWSVGYGIFLWRTDPTRMNF